VTADATSVLITLSNAEATRKFGAALADSCLPGTIVLLRGPLGAGKTTLVDGLVGQLGGGKATSPTFVLAHAHPGGKLPVWHLDLYRVEDEHEVAALDLAQYISDSAITICEWPERASGTWPQDVLTIELEVQAPGRLARITASGEKSGIVLASMRKMGAFMKAAQ
jgi:tRNA threonylcarbamoyladenosine biosynthesis protein TsaE